MVATNRHCIQEAISSDNEFESSPDRLIGTSGEELGLSGRVVVQQQ